MAPVKQHRGGPRASRRSRAKATPSLLVPLLLAGAAALSQAATPTRMILTVRVPDSAAAPQAASLAAASGGGAGGGDAPSGGDVQLAARVEAQAAAKARVLGGLGAQPADAAAAAGADGDSGDGGGGGVRVVRDFDHLPVAVVEVGGEGDLARLRAHPDVLSVEPHGWSALATGQTLPIISAPAAHAKGFMGAGCVVAVLDSGGRAARRAAIERRRGRRARLHATACRTGCACVHSRMHACTRACTAACARMRRRKHGRMRACAAARPGRRGRPRKGTRCCSAACSRP